MDTAKFGMTGVAIGRGRGSGVHKIFWLILVAISGFRDSYTEREGISWVTMAAVEPKPSLVERLFAEHGGGALQTFFLRSIRTKADAADLAQEVYLRMLRISASGWDRMLLCPSE